MNCQLVPPSLYNVKEDLIAWQADLSRRLFQKRAAPRISIQKMLLSKNLNGQRVEKEPNPCRLAQPGAKKLHSSHSQVVSHKMSSDYCSNGGSKPTFEVNVSTRPSTSDLLAPNVLPMSRRPVRRGSVTFSLPSYATVPHKGQPVTIQVTAPTPQTVKPTLHPVHRSNSENQKNASSNCNSFLLCDAQNKPFSASMRQQVNCPLTKEDIKKRLASKKKTLDLQYR